MTGKFIYDRYNGKFTWGDELAYRGKRKAAKSRKYYALHAKRKERNAAKREIFKEIAAI